MVVLLEFLDLRQKNYKDSLRRKLGWMCVLQDLLALEGRAYPPLFTSLYLLSPQLNYQQKVGIMYCKAGQSTEEEMYNNESAGPAFEEFLQLLGERVRLKGFEKYRAQLDTKSKKYLYLPAMLDSLRADVHLLFIHTQTAPCCRRPGWEDVALAPSKTTAQMASLPSDLGWVRAPTQRCSVQQVELPRFHTQLSVRRN